MTGTRDSGAARDASPFSTIWVAVMLAGVSGFVDAVNFTHVVGVFPANQSGNVVFLGLSIGGTSPAPGWAPPVAIAAFIVGAAIGHFWSLRLGRRRGAPMLLQIEMVLLTGLAIVFLVKGTSAFETTAAQIAALATAAVALGVQTDVVTAVAGVAVSTTYQTGAIARIGEAIGTPRGARDSRPTRRLLVVLSVVLLAYIAGAALGASRLGDGRTALLVPVALVAALVVVGGVRSRSADPRI